MQASLASPVTRQPPGSPVNRHGQTCRGLDVATRRRFLLVVGFDLTTDVPLIYLLAQAGRLFA